MQLSRREVFGLLAASAVAAADEWIPLFNGTDLTGWKANGDRAAWKARGGSLWAEGGRSYLYFTGREFRNFELELEARTQPAVTAGVHLPPAIQEGGSTPAGWQVAINNSARHVWQRTGSLKDVRGVYKPPAADGSWFRLNVTARGANVQVRVDGTLLVDYTDPAPPPRGRIALACHGGRGAVEFRGLRVRPLPDDAAAPGEPAVMDDTARRILAATRGNFPVVDYHAHLKLGLTLEQALARSRRDGLGYGIAVNCGKTFPVENDEGARAFHESMKGQPCYIAMQAEGREWMQMFTRKAVGLFDYVFTDSMTWTDNHGKRMRTWMPAEVGTIADPEEFMETLVDRATGILEHEPIDIYVNPTFVPDQLQKDYDRLWTDARIRRVVEAARRNQVAIELNDRYKLPGVRVVKAAKAAGCKFTFGTNNTGPADLGRSEYGLRMIEECGLKWDDFFVPGAWWPKAYERRGDLLKA